MKTRKLTVVVLAFALSVSAASFQAQAQELAKKDKNKPVALASSNPVIGSGTPGQITKWTGVNGSNTFTIGNSNITEDKFGKIGIGTQTPTSLLTVQGMIETTLGGYKFPDGTVQTTAGIAPTDVVKSLNGLRGDVQIVAGSNITITPAGNTLTVGVASPLEVRDLDNPARQPFQMTGTCGSVEGNLGCAINTGVPFGKRLVIEYISLRALMPAGQVAALDIETTLGGVPVLHQVPLSPPATGMFGTGPRASIGQQVRLYADPGTAVSIGATRSASVGEATFRFSMSGHLVNVP